VVEAREAAQRVAPNGGDEFSYRVSEQVPARA